MKRQSQIDQIAKLLSELGRKIASLNSVNLTDLSVHSEYLYRDLLNTVYGYSLQNANDQRQNAEAVDLIDDRNRIAVQVTADATASKLKSTVDSFIAQNLHKKYDRLVVLQLRDDSKHRAGKVGRPGVFQIDKKRDVWNNQTLLKTIQSLQTEQIQKIRRLLEDALTTVPVWRRIALTVSAAAAIVVAISFVAISSARSDRDDARKDRLAADERLRGTTEERDALRQEMILAQQRLQAATERERTTLAHLDAAADWAESLAEHNPDFRSLSEHLTKVTDRFVGSFGDDDIPSEDAVLVRLARATVANLRGNHREADSLLTDADLEKHANDFVRLHVAKADAGFGLRKWESALGYYQRAASVQGTIYVKLRIADCYYYLHRTTEADSIWADVGAQLESEFTHGDRSRGQTYATAMVNRSGVLLDQDKPAESYSFATAGLGMLRLLRTKAEKDSDRVVLDLDIARTHARIGSILEASELYPAAELHYMQTVSALKALEFGRYPPDYLADALHDLGAIRLKQERIDDAVDPIRAACALYDQLVARGHREFTTPLAICLAHLGQATYQSDSKEAKESLGRAVELLDGLATDTKTKKGSSEGVAHLWQRIVEAR
jgi:tetratricopeptide (TPR) repeat protein